MHVRAATLSDVPRIVQMAERMLRETAYGALLYASRPDQLPQLVELIIERGGVIFLAERVILTVGQTHICGFLALCLLTHPFTGTPYADELAWWVDPEQRKSRAGYQMLCAAEDWARQNQCQCLKMLAPAGAEGDRVGRFYQHRGYQPVETVWQLRC